MAKKHRKNKNSTADVFSDTDLKARIDSQEAALEEDVDLAIEDFVTNGNIYFAYNVLKAIEACGDPHAGFEAWKNYALTGNDVALSKSLRPLKVPLQKLYSLKKAIKQFEQRQDNMSPRNLKGFASRNIFTAFNAAAKRLRKSENRGGLTDEQKVIFDTFSITRWMFDGPNTDIHPLTAALAKDFKQGVHDKLIVSYEALKEHVRKREPLIDEDKIYAVREAVLADSRERFERLKEQHGEAHNQTLPEYNFDSSQMPDNIDFGVEFEGFTSLKTPYPKSIFELARHFKQHSLKAIASLNPRASSGYKSWNITIDGSIITPRDFIGRHKTHDLVVQNSPSMEIVSPILKGAEGHEEMLRAIDALKEVAFKSNETCGMHMHIGIKHLPFEQQKNLALAIYKNHDELDKLLSEERHGDGNKFASSLKGVKLKDIKDATDAEELVEALNPGKNRYSKYDITGLVLPAAPPTIQYRGAGGANYLNITSDYTIILANFTAQALKNPNVELKDVIDGLIAQRDKLKPAKKSPAARKQPSPIK